MRERKPWERNIDQPPLTGAPTWPNPQPRHVPGLGSELVTLHLGEGCPTNWDTLVRAQRFGWYFLFSSCLIRFLTILLLYFFFNFSAYENNLLEDRMGHLVSHSWVKHLLIFQYSNGNKVWRKYLNKFTVNFNVVNYHSLKNVNISLLSYCWFIVSMGPTVKTISFPKFPNPWSL